MTLVAPAVAITAAGTGSDVAIIPATAYRYRAAIVRTTGPTINRRLRGINITGIILSIVLSIAWRPRFRTPVRTLERRAVLIFWTPPLRTVFLRLPAFLTRIGMSVFLAVIAPPPRRESALAFSATRCIAVVAITWRGADFQLIELIPFRITAISIGDGEQLSNPAANIK